MKRNKMSLICYTELLIFLSIIFMTVYIQYFSIISRGIFSTISQSIGALCFAAWGWADTFDCARNEKSLILISIFPCLFWETLELCKLTVSLRFFAISVLGITLITSAIYVWFRYPKKRKRFLMNLKKTICVCSVAAFAIITFYGHFLYMTNHSVYFSQVEEKEKPMEDEEEQLDPNCLAANIETVAKMDPSNGWSELSEEEIAEVLETVIRIEARYLGTASDYPALSFAYVPTSELGHYDSANNIITISYNYILEAEDGYAVSEVVAHEMRHLYQHFQTELYSAIQENKEFEKYKDLLMFVPIEQYQQEMENYANGSDDSDEYIQQQMEIDAFAYGKEAAEEYREAVKEYLQRKE